ncbi:MAG: hypothetical protein C0391_06815 [Anaerolinea sp.]|nr:hypothetical protein [Anaerolinea sp.]
METTWPKKVAFKSTLIYAHAMKMELIIPILLILMLTSACAIPSAKPYNESNAVPVEKPATATQPELISTSSPETNVEEQPEGTEFDLLELRMITAEIGWVISGVSGKSLTVLRTIDGGKSWVDTRLAYEAGRDPNSTRLASFFLDENIAWVAPYMTALPPLGEQVIWRTDDGGRHWKAATIPVDGLMEAFSISHIQFINAYHGWLMAHVGAGMNHDYIVIYRTGDGGETWDKVVDPMNDPSGIQSCQKTGLLFVDAREGWLTGTCNGVAAGVLLFHTSDGGAFWEDVQLPDPPGQAGLYANFDAVCASQFPHAGVSSIQLEVACKIMSSPLEQPLAWLYTSSNDGVEWTITNIPAGGLTYLPGGGVFIQGETTSFVAPAGDLQAFPNLPDGFRMHFINDQLGWMISAAGEVLSTVDGGLTWTAVMPQLIE